MYKTLTALAVAATMTVAVVGLPRQAEAGGGGLAAGIIGGVAAGAIIGSVAANNGYYGGPGYYGPGYGYGPQPAYYGYRHYRHCWWRYGRRICR
jgi:hypothetical protein